MYRKYFVYLDDGEDVFKVAIAAKSEEAAIAWCSGNGEVIAVKDVTEDYPISLNKVSEALEAAGFGIHETDIICRLLLDFGVAE